MPAAPRDAVRVAGLFKSFPRKRTVKEIVRAPFRRSVRIEALRGVAFTVREGELVGLLGPNGAGKTTLLKILCGLVLPERGQAELFGVPAGDPSLPDRLGLVHGDERSFYWRLTARENLDFFARLHGLSGAVRESRVTSLLEKVQLAADAQRRFSDFSSGMKQRLAIARALLADPPIVLMDEPTRSLDPVSAAVQREWIREELHRRDGKTILLATHNLREAEALCDRVVVIARGELRAEGSPEELRHRGLGGVVYRLRLAGTVPSALASGQVLSQVAVDSAAELLVRLAKDDAGLDPVLRELTAAGARILAAEPEEPELETVFRELVEDRAPGSEPGASGRGEGGTP
ncbi:MAG: ABC transporter ATP-binding protein [Acidobacteria bacterium]|nr:ABC transporter ATP-binding protein [Acidobacteriota bacterium]